MEKKAKLLMTDTDSLCYEIETEDFYKDISNDVEDKYDTSNLPKDHPSGIQGKNKKVPRMMKDEAGGEIIEKFVGLCTKLYSYLMFEGKEKKCKGIKKSVVKNKITFKNFEECLFTEISQLEKMNVIRSHKHEIFSETINKIALPGGEDDKRIQMKDKISTLAPGHYKTIISLKKMPKVISKAIEILKIILELLKTLKEKIVKRAPMER